MLLLCAGLDKDDNGLHKAVVDHACYRCYVLVLEVLLMKMPTVTNALHTLSRCSQLDKQELHLTDMPIVESVRHAVLVLTH